jgi:hypothetical protein
MEPVNTEPDVPFPFDGDNVIVYQSWFNQWPFLLLGIMAIAGALWAASVYPDRAHLRISESFELPLIPMIPLALLGKWAWSTMNVKLVLTPEYLILLDGVLSWRQRTVRLEYQKIQEIEVQQTIPQRILGIGDVSLIPVATSKHGQVTMPGVPSPRVLKDILRFRQHNSPLSAAREADIPST